MKNGHTLTALPDMPQPTAADLRILDSWELSLRAKRSAPKTQECYLGAGRLLARWVRHTKRSGLFDLGYQDLQAYVAWMNEEARTRSGKPYAPGYVSNQFRAIQALYKWATKTEEEYDLSPMTKLETPAVDNPGTPTLTDEQVTVLLKSVEKGRDFDSRRDYAILRVFFASGVRIQELTSLGVADVDLKSASGTVTGKGNRGRKTRTMKFDYKTAQAIDRYLRKRDDHKLAHLPNLWLGTNHRPPLIENGIRQMVRRRARAVGIKLHPHVFRHTFATNYVDNGGQSEDLMELMGWSSPQMVARYTKLGRSRIARRNYDAVNPTRGL